MDIFIVPGLPKLTCPDGLILPDKLYPPPTPPSAYHSKRFADCDGDAEIDKPVVPADEVRIFSIDKFGTVPIPTLPPIMTD